MIPFLFPHLSTTYVEIGSGIFGKSVLYPRLGWKNLHVDNVISWRFGAITDL